MTATDNSLSEVIALAREKGFAGVALIHQGGNHNPYVAVCLNRNGTLSDVRNYDTQPTAEQAVEDLRQKLTRL